MTLPPPPPTTSTATSTTNNNSNKKLKYESLCIDIQRMWNLEFMIILVIIGATRLTTMFKEIFGNDTRKTFSRFATKDSYTWNITHNTENAVV
jgi:hypothetical protein